MAVVTPPSTDGSRQPNSQQRHLRPNPMVEALHVNTWIPDFSEEVRLAL